MLRKLPAILLAAAWFVPAAPPPKPVRVEVVTGGHDHDAEFYTLFLKRPDLSVNINPHPNAYTGDLRGSTDVLVLYDMVQASALDAVRRKNLRDFLESGKGLVVLHHAIADYADWPWWYEQVVGGRYLLKPDGNQPASTFRHDQDMYVERVAGHPITRGLGPIHVRDETYKGVWISPGVTVLLRTTNPNADGPVAWISPYARSRVVYIGLGHDRQTLITPAYLDLIHRAILWTAGRLD